MGVSILGRILGYGAVGVFLFLCVCSRGISATDHVNFWWHHRKPWSTEINQPAFLCGMSEVRAGAGLGWAGASRAKFPRHLPTVTLYKNVKETGVLAHVLQVGLRTVLATHRSRRNYSGMLQTVSRQFLTRLLKVLGPSLVLQRQDSVAHKCQLGPRHRW